MITISIPWFILHVDNVRMKIVLDDIKIDAYFLNIYIYIVYDQKKRPCYVSCFIFNLNTKRTNHIFVYNFYLLLCGEISQQYTIFIMTMETTKYTIAVIKKSILKSMLD